MAYTVSIHSGEVQMADYTPGSAVSAGDVVVQGDVVGVALHDIAASKLGALGINGGVWECPKATTSVSALSAGTLVYWDATNDIVTATAGSNKVFGYVVIAAGATASTVYVAKVLP